ncbi:hypothetical protein FHG64_10740 [Antarcticibacterium flavum]|uniref:Beta-lactamase-inhibitor-like PepSY-like domain-containing protein n=1 Tax=Antarcticibacterium flavum TaxID=2058175 RepID=A0A5B7X556_9FLAO|nr:MULTISPECIES: hypothetical protein [Antarcticibacterium]MCM4160495.1 hypothetical protein [Antarcticibacterium sp. W02-3]QCY69841.1 hypothetical protein FHG64_10740 [Antarcticibacterium flavum]
MKKLVLTFAALGLFITTTQAQVAEANTDVYVDSQTEVAVVGDDFEEIDVTEIPAAVNEAITRDFDGATVQEAWVKEKDDKKVYKIKLNVSGEEKKVYADEEGNWIDMKDKKDKDRS